MCSYLNTYPHGSGEENSFLLLQGLLPLNSFSSGELRGLRSGTGVPKSINNLEKVSLGFGLRLWVRTVMFGLDFDPGRPMMRLDLTLRYLFLDP